MFSYGADIRYACPEDRDVKRGQMLEAKAEAEAKHLRPRSRPRPES